MQMTMTFKEPQKAFEEAIDDGILSADPQSELYAGRFMYMGTTSYGKNKFKHIETREYIN